MSKNCIKDTCLLFLVLLMGQCDIEPCLGEPIATVYNQQTMIKTKSGNIYNGFKVARNKEAVILRDIAGKQQMIPLDQISSEQILQNSLMPDPRYLGLDQQDVADVTEYLLTLR